MLQCRLWLLVLVLFCYSLGVVCSTEGDDTNANALAALEAALAAHEKSVQTTNVAFEAAIAALKSRVVSNSGSDPRERFPDTDAHGKRIHSDAFLSRNFPEGVDMTAYSADELCAAKNWTIPKWKTMAGNGKVYVAPSCEEQGKASQPASLAQRFVADVVDPQLKKVQDEWDDYHCPTDMVPKQFKTATLNPEGGFSKEFFDGLDPSRRIKTRYLVNDTTRLAVFDDFISEGECDRLFDIKSDILDGNKTTRGSFSPRLQNKDGHQPGRGWFYSYMRPWDDKVVMDVEERVARYTQAQAHMVERGLTVTTLLPSENNKFKDTHNVHHDLDGSPCSFVTMIMYCRDASLDEGMGGGTVFPFLGAELDGILTSPKKKKKKDKNMKDKRKNLKDAAAEWSYNKMVQKERTWNIMPSNRNLANDNERLLWGATDTMCKERETHPERPNVGPNARGTYVELKAGTAVMFYSRMRNGLLDPNSLHSGCAPKNGNEKEIVQKFKSFYEKGSPSLVADKPDVFGVLNHPYAPWVIADNPESAKHFAVSPAMKAYASEYHAQKNTQ